jgi:hypothetical protein
MVETTKIEDHFSLSFISARLINFRIPEGPFDPGGDWQLDYGVYTFTSQSRQPVPGGLVGRMRLARKAAGEGEATLKLDYEKNAPGVLQKVAAEIRCKTDVLSTPIWWNYSARVVNGEGKPYENSVVAKRAEAADGRIEIVDDRSRQRIAVNGPFSVNWALWDAVMRMPREPGEPVRFTMLDHFDQLKHRQTLAYRKSVVVALGQRRFKQQTSKELEKGRIQQTRWATTGGREVILHGFEQLGEGIVPWVYWVDDQGRLLFAVSGLEVYVLDSWHDQEK